MAEAATKVQRSRPTSNLPQRSQSVKQMVDETVTQIPEQGLSQARNISPTRLPTGLPSRSMSVKQLPTMPSLKPSLGHQRQGSLTKPSLTKPRSQIEPVKRLVSKETTLEPSLGRASVSTRQISPSKSAPQALQESRIKALKAPSRSIYTASSPVTKADSQGSVTAPIRKQIQANAAVNLERPGFSANQQRFSPKRPAHGQSSASPAPRQLYTREALESSLELLHSHFLHHKSAKVQAEWKASAKSSYKKQFESIAALNASLNEQDKDAAEQNNAESIMAWGSHNGADTIERKVRVLSIVVSEAWDLTEPHGKYTMAMQAFGHWYDSAEEVQKHRLDDRGFTGVRVDIMEGLGDGWKAEISALQGRLLQAANSLLTLGEIQGQSDLSRCMLVLSEMIENMLEELELVENIEDAMVKQEEFWVRNSINRLDSDLRGNVPTTPVSERYERRAR